MGSYLVGTSSAKTNQVMGSQTETWVKSSSPMAGQKQDPSYSMYSQIELEWVEESSGSPTVSFTCKTAFFVCCFHAAYIQTRFEAFVSSTLLTISYWVISLRFMLASAYLLWAISICSLMVVIKLLDLVFWWQLSLMSSHFQCSYR